MDEIDCRGLILRRGKQRLQDIQEMDVKRHGFPRSDRAWVEEGILKDAIPVHRVTRLTELNRTSSTYTAYGNEPSLGHVYGNAALFVQVPALGKGVRTKTKLT
ncbi:hypothetical protein B0H19DRAFT_1257014 [Mycena capillaripes]|nr:hypothetical protein B0H19DRAFT_1257014 [Mycena capillaripes]